MHPGPNHDVHKVLPVTACKQLEQKRSENTFKVKKKVILVVCVD